MSERGAAVSRSAESPALTAHDIATLVGGRVEGDAGAVVHGIAPLDRAQENQLSFLAIAKYAASFASSNAGVVLISPELAASPGKPRARIVVDRPQEAMLAVLPRFHSAPTRIPDIHATARIGRGVSIGARVTIGPNVVVGDDVFLGDDCWLEAGCVVGQRTHIGASVHLYPTVTIYHDVRVGDRTIVHAGARIGSDGFGYVFRDNAHVKIPHAGGCIIGEDVEIGANATIDRGSVDDTVVGSGTKIDNLVHIGHNVRIGRLCLIMAQAGIAGSVRVEDGAILAGQVGLAGHITIGRGARVGAQAGVFGDVPAGETWSGYPARPHKESLRAQGVLFKLAARWKQFEKLLGQGKTADGSDST
jgi:UDP-3-O-[3-hydroxymyristoyl] glucosamine N-acyltransferase